MSWSAILHDADTLCRRCVFTERRCYSYRAAAIFKHHKHGFVGGACFATFQRVSLVTKPSNNRSSRIRTLQGKSASPLDAYNLAHISSSQTGAIVGLLRNPATVR